MKTVSCRDVGVECDFEAHGQTDEEIIKQCEKHARTQHGMEKLSADMIAKVKAAIREEKAA
jgi:predicted small metal-binding protein